MLFDVNEKQDTTPWPMLLARYFQMYWLKPFDAVNDAANAAALLRFDWSRGPVLEIGGGDGVFSFIMHGGKFSFLNDRYDQTDLTRPHDIYDTYAKGLSLSVQKKPFLQYDAGVDLKMSHLFKSRETFLYRENNLISAKPECLPVKNNYFSTVFLYTFHGLIDYRASLSEIRRVMKEDGMLLMIVFNDIVKKHFVCFRLHKYFEKKGMKRLSAYFSKLDGGRHEEIGSIFSRSFDDWKKIIDEAGFCIDEVYTQVSPFLWRIYDTQTRPALKSLIKLNNFIKVTGTKALVKFFWIYTLLPILMIFYILFAQPARSTLNNVPGGIFLQIKATPK